MKPLRFIVASIAVIALIGVVGPLVIPHDPVGGRGYFSPDTLWSKSQSEYLVSWSEFEYHRYELVEFLIDHGYWIPVETDEPRWILMTHWNKAWTDGQSRIFREIAWRGEEWIVWTKQNPDLAAVLWPHVLKMLRSPDNLVRESANELMFLAKYAKSPQKIEDAAAKLWQEFARP